MNSAAFLDVGRADCSVLRLDTPNGSAVIVIDGGTKFYNDRRVLLEYLKEHQIEKIDLLILTHLHQDHFGGFYHLIDKIPICKAIIPYGDIVFNPYVRDYYINFEFFLEYHEFYRYLQESGTTLLLPEFCANQAFSFGQYSLRCLYPLDCSLSLQYKFIDRLCSDDLSHEDAEHNSTQFRALCNESSSIWLLTKNDEDVILFSGDCTADTMDKAVLKHPIHPNILKLSHHGINIKYFSKKQIKNLNPKRIIISNSKDMIDTVSNDSLPIIPSNCDIIYTFDGDYEIEI